jgi:iron complex outermembrane receptor protein
VGQGLSGTMDIQTIRPLDLRGRQIAVNLRGERNSNGTMVPGVASLPPARDSASPTSTSLPTNTIGVALGYARLDAATQLKQFQIWDFAGMDQQWIDWGARVAGDLPRATNGGASALMPMGMEATAATKRNKRDGLMAVLEYKPNKDLHSRLDLYYSKFDTREVGRKFMTQTWAMWDGADRSPVINNAKTTEVGLNTIITSGTFSQMPTVLQNFETKRKDDIKAAGLEHHLQGRQAVDGRAGRQHVQGRARRDLLRELHRALRQWRLDAGHRTTSTCRRQPVWPPSCLRRTSPAPPA